jgi:hypothetical protein
METGPGDKKTGDRIFLLGYRAIPAAAAYKNDRGILLVNARLTCASHVLAGLFSFFQDEPAENCPALFTMASDLVYSL